MLSRKSKLLNVCDQLNTHKAQNISDLERNCFQSLYLYLYQLIFSKNPYHLHFIDLDMISWAIISRACCLKQQIGHITPQCPPNLYLWKPIHSGKLFVKFKLEYHPPSCCYCALLDNVTYLITTYIHSSSPFINKRMAINGDIKSFHMQTKFDKQQCHSHPPYNSNY